MASATSPQARMIVHLFRKRRGRIGLTYLALGIENVFDLLYPLLIGIAINGLLAGNIHSLIPLGAVWFAHILVGGARQLYDTRLFGSIFVEVAAELASKVDEDEENLSQASAHIVMAQEVVDFYEFDIPTIASVSIALVGSVFLLLFYDAMAGLIVLGLMIPAAVMNRWLAKRSLQLNRMLNNQHERQIKVLAASITGSIRNHFDRIKRFKVNLSDAEAFAWTLIEGFTLVLSLAVIWRLATLPDATAGSIFAGVAYLLRIIDELDRVPELIQRIARLADIRRRLSHSED